MTLVQIVPNLPPARNGVGSFAAAMGTALARRGLASTYLVAAPGWRESEHLGGEPIGEQRSTLFAAQIEATGADILLTHYVNYGYQRRGCPAWLVAGLLRWRH